MKTLLISFRFGIKRRGGGLVGNREVGCCLLCVACFVGYRVKIVEEGLCFSDICGGA